MSSRTRAALRQGSKRLAVAVALALLAACSTQVHDQVPAPGPKTHDGTVVPAPEPRSRYGNPASYEEMGRRYVVLETASGYRERGVASWYGKKFHGRRTSSGETYDMHAMTAAHKTLPLPTWVEVKNLRSGRKIIVRVNDRGPFVENRIIDLSYEAAKRLDIITDGTGLVEVRTLHFDQPEPATGVLATTETAPPENIKPTAGVPVAATDTDIIDATPPVLEIETIKHAAAGPRMYAQVGAFSDRTNAAGLHLRLRQTGFNNALIHDSGLDEPDFYRVRIGPIDAVEAYDALVERLRDMGIAQVNMIIE